MMAFKPPFEPVFDQPGGTVWTFKAVPAGPAKGQRRITAPVQKKHDLFTGRQRIIDRLLQGRRQPALAIEHFIAHIDKPDGRQARAGMPLRQGQPVVTPGLGIDHGLQRRRRGGQHDREFAHARPHHRHVARVVDDAIFLFEGTVMFLVHNDQAERGERQKKRRALPEITARQPWRRSAPVRSECHSNGGAPNRAVKRLSHWAVRAISGTRTNA